ncbi:MAG: hypothetical protein AAGF91_05820 [Actinomycetota bacterium]
MKPVRAGLASLAAVSAALGLLAVVQTGGTASGADSTIEVQISGVNGVPDDADAAVLNVAVARATEVGFVTIWSCDDDMPTASSLNYEPGPAVSNSTIVELSDEGAVCIYRSSDAELIVDVNGVFPEGSSFDGNNPYRLLDTRDSRPIGAGETISVQVAGEGPIAGSARTATLNLTAVRPADRGHIIAWPCDQDRPTASILNYEAGSNIANSAELALAADGTLCLYASSRTDLLVDANGVITGAGLDGYVPLRVLDTRSGQANGAGETHVLDVADAAGIGNNSSVVLNIAAAQASSSGFVVAWPCGQDMPTASILNYSAGEPISNATVLGLGEGGTICLSTSTSVHLIVDLNGVIPNSSGVDTFSPTRVLDTRPAGGSGGSGGGGGGDDSGGGPDVSGTQFAATFDGNTGLDDFDWGVYHRDTDLVDQTSWSADHDTDCGSPDSQRTINRNSSTGWRYLCRDHVMTSIGDTSGYSTGWFAPTRSFSNARTVSWDVNVTDLKGRQWWEVMVVPSSFSTGIADCPQCAAAPWMNDTAGLPTYPNGSVVVANGPFGGDIRIHVDGNDMKVQDHTHMCDLDREGCESKAIRRTFSITDNGDGSLTIQYGNAATYRVPGSLPDRFDVILKDHNYTPNKDGDPVGYTWHWDNIIVR